MSDDSTVDLVAQNLEYWLDVSKLHRWRKPDEGDPILAIAAAYGDDATVYPEQFESEDRKLGEEWRLALARVAGSEAQDLRILNDMGLLFQEIEGLNVDGIRHDASASPFFKFNEVRHQMVSIWWRFDRVIGEHRRCRILHTAHPFGKHDFFENSSRWTPSVVQCRHCPMPLYKAIFSSGYEVTVQTTEPSTPAIRVKRLYTCQYCGTFVTTGISEDEWREASRIGQIGYDLSGPTHFFYATTDWQEYADTVSALDPIASDGGRADGGYICAPQAEAEDRSEPPVVQIAPVLRWSRLLTFWRTRK